MFQGLCLISIAEKFLRISVGLTFDLNKKKTFNILWKNNKYTINLKKK